MPRVNKKQRTKNKEQITNNKKTPKTLEKKTLLLSHHASILRFSLSWMVKTT
jgi:hypothetical protein